MTDALRFFTSEGITKFRDFLAHLRQNTAMAFPENLLYDEEFTYEKHGYDIKQIHFKTKLEAARYLYPIISRMRSDNPKENPYGNTYLWSWLAAYYFDTVCPVEPSGERKIRRNEKYILMPRWDLFHRHLLATPVRVYETHDQNPEECMILLDGPLHIQGEFVEQLMSSQDIALNRSAIAAANTLYWDQEKSEPRKVRGKNEPGKLRRFVAVFKQFDLTYDLYSMESSEIIDIYPEEFHKFLV